MCIEPSAAESSLIEPSAADSLVEVSRVRACTGSNLCSHASLFATIHQFQALMIHGMRSVSMPSAARARDDHLWPPAPALRANRRPPAPATDPASHACTATANTSNDTAARVCVGVLFISPLRAL